MRVVHDAEDVWVPDSAGVGGSVQIQTPQPVDNYIVWGRINAPWTADNSFYVSSDFGPKATWPLRITSATAWTWARVENYGVPGPYPLRLDDCGFVHIDRRKAGSKLDKIIVTNDPGFTPVEPGPPVLSP